MARIILLLTGAIVTIIAVPMYFLLCLWIAIFEEYERNRRKRKEKENEQGRSKGVNEADELHDNKSGGK